MWSRWMSTTQAGSGWNSCPEDVWFLVFKELSITEHRALCLVNKHCRTIAAPFLYSKIQWIWRKEYPDHSSRFPQLLRTLLSRPQLAAYITTLHLEGNCCFIGPHRFRWNLPKFPLADDELHQSIEFIRQTGVSYSDIWIEKLRQGTADALIALLLTQLPNLKCLYLSRDFTRETALIGMMLRSAILEPGNYRLPSFTDLRDVSFLRRRDRDEAYDEKIRNTADILPLFYLPSLQRMSASIQNPNEWAWPSAQPPVPLRLTSLDLTIIREGCLGKVLAVTPNLDTLRWDWYFDWGVYDKFITQTIDLDKIAAELSYVRGSLTNLTITATMGIALDPFRPALKTEGSLREMVSFNMLRRLQVPWAFLVGFAQDTTKRLRDVIPKNIEHLTVTDDLAWQNDDAMERDWPEWEWQDYVILDLLEAWLEDWKEYTPHLRGITLSLSWIDTDMEQWSPGIRNRLTELGTQAGISLELIELEVDLSRNY